MPGKRITSSVIQSIHLLAHTLLKANGEPNQNAIAKQLGIAPNSVKRHLTVYAEKTVELQPSMQQIDRKSVV